MKKGVIAEKLCNFYDADDYLGEAIRIETSLCATCDGEGVVFFLTIQDGHKTKLTANRNFSDWLEYTAYGTEYYREDIEKVCARFACTWDFDKKELSILFRRNEFSLAEAYFRLTECAFILASLR